MHSFLQFIGTLLRISLLLVIVIIYERLKFRWVNFAYRISQVSQSLIEGPDEDSDTLNLRITKPRRKMKAGRMRKREDQTKDPLVGSIAQAMTGCKGGGPKGRRTTLYIIGDYLYVNGFVQSDSQLRARCRHYHNGAIPCRASALIDRTTLEVIKMTGSHSCLKDPDMKFQIQMETEMKELAATTSYDLKDIYERVCQKNPSMAIRIPYKRICVTMNRRRKEAIARKGDL